MRDLEIFSQAIEIGEPAKRQEFVRAACLGDANLLARVEKLLQAHQQSESILEHPLVASGLAEQLVEHAFTPKVDPNNETSSHHARNPQDLLDGTERKIGPYRLLEKIGEGGFGEVFVAEQTEPVQRKVAIKIIKPGMDSREVVARFAAERQALAMMDHPNIARVFDAGTTPRGLPYFIMELVRGMNIVKYCDTAKLPIEKRLWLFIDTCRAIQHAHQKGIIHRDIKPSNVMVTLHDGEPVVKVIDFGVAKALNQRLTNMTIYTRFSFMIGTPAYMSPEQAELSGLDIDTRSDIYSLGVLLYELVTGSPPFMLERFATATMDEMRRIIRDEEPPRPSTRISSLGESSSSVAQLRSVQPERLQTILRRDLDWIAMKALAKDRSQRYETANGLAADVKRFLEGEAVTARPPSWSYLASRFVRRNRGLVISAALIFAALFLGSVISISLAIWAVREQRIAYEQEQLAINKTNEAIEQQERAERAEFEAIGNLLESRLAFTDLNLKSRRPGQQAASLAAIRESIDLARQTNTLDQHTLRLRTQAISAMARVDLDHQRTIETPPEAASFYSFTADFSKVAYRIREDDKNFVTVRDVESPDRELHRVLFPFSTQTAFHDEVVPKLSPDGRYLAMGSNEVGMILWELSRGVLVRELKTYFPIGGFQFSSDSTMFAVVERGPGNTQDRVNICRLPSGEIERYVSVPLARQVSFSPDGKLIALGGQEVLWVCEVATGRRLASLEKPYGTWGPALAWSASAEYLAVSLDRQIEVWNVEEVIEANSKKAAIGQGKSTGTLTPVSVLTGHEGKVESLTFHPTQESLLISTGWDNTTRLWNIFSGTEQLMVPESRPSISADGQRLATAVASGFRVVGLLAGDACRWIYRGVAAQIAHDPQGNWVAVGTGRGTRFWSLPDLRPLGKIGHGESYGVVYDLSREGLLVGNQFGMFELPVTSDGRVLKAGPSHQLLTTSRSHFGHVRSSPDGRWVASGEVGTWEPILVDRLDGTARRHHRDARSQSIAISGNSQWLAQFLGDQVIVRDLNSGKDVAELIFSGTNNGVSFSPDSCYLLLSSNLETQFVNTATWEVEHSFGPAIRIFFPGFFNDQHACVLPTGPGELSIVSMDGPKILASLSYPDPPRLFADAILTNNDQFLAVTHESSAAVWDLGLIRRQLQELGLDWNPTSPPTVATPLRIDSLKILPGELETLRQFVERMDAAPRHDVVAIADEMIQSGLELPDLYRFRGWSYEALGDVDAACQDLKRAIEMAPYAESWRLACANCLLQAGRFSEAWEVLWSMADPNHSNLAVDSFQQLCTIFSVRPEAVSNLPEFEELLEKWQAALSGEDTSSSFGIKVAGLSDVTKQILWESVGMAFYGVGQTDRSLAILEKHKNERRQGGVSVLAAIYADKGESEATDRYLQTALNFARNNPGTVYTRHNLEFYDPLHEKAIFRLNQLLNNDADEESISPTTDSLDSLDLARAATANFGRIFLHPTNDSPEVNEALSDNILWWELVRPEHEIRFELPVPGPGKYRLSARFAGAYYCGIFKVIGQTDEEGPTIDLYHSRKLAADPVLNLINNVELGEFQAVNQNLATQDTPAVEPLEATESAAQPFVGKWTVPLVLRAIGKHEKSPQYSLLIDEIRWERVEQ